MLKNLGVLPGVGYTGRLRPKRGALFELAVGENLRFSMQRVTKPAAKWKKWDVAKAKYIKGCHILAEVTAQLNQND